MNTLSYPHEQPLTKEQLAFLDRIRFQDKRFGLGYHRFFDVVVSELAKNPENPHIYRAQINAYLNQLDEYTRFKKPTRKRVDTKSIYSDAAGKMLQADTLILGAELKSSKQHTCIMTVIDIYSRYVWLFPQRSTTMKETNKNIQVVLDELKSMGISVGAIQTDNGSEFAGLSQIIDPKRIVKAPAGVPQRSAMVETFHNRTRAFLREYTAHVTNKRGWYIDLERMLQLYNKTKHSVTKCTPWDALEGTAIPADSLGSSPEAKTRDTDKPLELGATVRIRDEKRSVIDKNKPFYSDGTFTIEKIRQGTGTNRTTYLLSGKRKYYNSSQLQVVGDEQRVITHKPSAPVRTATTSLQSGELPTPIMPRRSERLAAKKGVTAVRRVPVRS